MRIAREHHEVSPSKEFQVMSESLTITDNRTRHTFDVPVEEGTIRATAFREARVADDDFGLMSYDPAFLNTVSAEEIATP
jgi:citrate synthase